MADYFQVKNQNIFNPPANTSLGNASNQFNDVYVQNDLVLGNVTVTGTNTCGNGTTASLAVTVLPLPAVTLTLSPFLDTICLSAPGVALSGGMPAGGTYTGLGVINGNFYASQAGVGTHQIIYYNNPVNCLNCGCENSDTAYIVVDACTGINEMANIQSLRVYPNPSTNVFFIEAALSKNENVRIEIVDVIGQTIFVSEENAAVGIFKKQINSEKFAKGIYVVSVKTNEGISVQRIVKE